MKEGRVNTRDGEVGIKDQEVGRRVGITSGGGECVSEGRVMGLGRRERCR